jgi:hypothetical protein
MRNQKGLIKTALADCWSGPLGRTQIFIRQLDDLANCICVNAQQCVLWFDDACII